MMSSGFPVKTLAEFFRPQPARVPGVVVIRLLLGFHARHLHLFGVDDDHVIAGIEERRVLGAFLPHQDAGDLGGQPAEDLP